MTPNVDPHPLAWQIRSLRYKSHQSLTNAGRSAPSAAAIQDCRASWRAAPPCDNTYIYTRKPTQYKIKPYRARQSGQQLGTAGRANRNNRSSVVGAPVLADFLASPNIVECVRVRTKPLLGVEALERTLVGVLVPLSSHAIGPLTGVMPSILRVS